MAYEIPLVVSAVVFAAFMVFRFRPVVSEGGRATAAALKDAKARISSAKDGPDRARALADAADACARLGRTGAAVAFYLRALRAAPASAEIVTRASEALAERPRALEKIMWRHLGSGAWTGERREAAILGLRALAASYARRPRFHPRARAIEHAIEALGMGDASDAKGSTSI